MLVSVNVSEIVFPVALMILTEKLGFWYINYIINNLSVHFRIFLRNPSYLTFSRSYRQQNTPKPYLDPKASVFFLCSLQILLLTANYSNNHFFTWCILGRSTIRRWCLWQVASLFSFLFPGFDLIYKMISCKYLYRRWQKLKIKLCSSIPPFWFVPVSHAKSWHVTYLTCVTVLS